MVIEWNFSFCGMICLEFTKYGMEICVESSVWNRSQNSEATINDILFDYQ